MAERAATTACTITARDRLPFAHVLATSYLKHHPDHDFVVLVTDGVPADHPVSGYRLVGPEALDTDIDDYLRMATIYTAAELASAVKPLLLRSLLTRAAAVVFLRPDIRLYAPLPDVTALAVEHDIVLA